MNSRERIEAILANAPVDHVPFAILDGGAWAESETDLTYREFLSLEDAGASVIVKKFDEIHADIVSSCGAFASGYLGALGNQMDLDVKHATVNSKPTIEDPEEDILKLDISSIRENLDQSWVWQRLLHQTREIKKLVGDTKLIGACIAGPFTAAGMLVGVQDFMMMLLDEDLEEQLKHILAYGLEASVLAYEDLHAAGVDIAWLGEPVASGAMISQSMFEEFAMGPIREAYTRLRRSYRYIFMHMCGNSGPRVSTIKEIGFDAFSVDSMVDLEKAGRDSEGEMVLLGNIGPASPLRNGTPQEVETAAREAAAKAKAGGGRLILCPGCDVPVGTPTENLLALHKVAGETA